MAVILKPISNDLVQAFPAWATKSELREYFRNYPPLHEWNRPDLVLARLDWSYGIYEDEKLVGSVQLFQSNPVAKTIELGMIIDNEVCTDRKAVAYEANLLITDYIFQVLGYRKIYMRVLCHRTSLLERLKKFGYVIEGTFKESAKHDGVLKDEYYLALFKKD